MEAQHKDGRRCDAASEPQRSSLFGTPSRRAVVGAGCAVAAGALVAGGGLGAYMAADDPLTDEPHGRGNATGACAADDVILSMCNNCNSYCTIKVRVTDAADGKQANDGATALVRKIAGNPYSPLNSQPYAPIPYATRPEEALAPGDDMAVAGRASNGGMICLKGQAGIQLVHDRFRITQPLRRVGERGSDEWETVSWDTALDEIVNGSPALGTPGIAEWYAYAPKKQVEADVALVESGEMTKDAFAAKWADKLIDVEHPDLGPKSNLFCSAGGDRMFLIGDRLTQLGFGSVNNFNHGGVCGMTGVMANVRTHPTTNHKRMYADIDHCECLIIWGTEPMTANKGPSWLAPRLSVARERGMKLYVVDPRQGRSASKADVWLPVRPATDTGLLLCWFRYIFENKLYDEQFTKYWTNLPFLIDPETKLPVKAQELFPDFQQTTPENTPAYVCYDLKTNAVAPFEFSAPADAAVNPEIFWTGDFEGKTYKTAGQIYKEEADPWTLEHTAENCWLDADKIEKAIKIYAEASVAGIANGVASDMTESASQVPLGCMGLDSIMGYVNKPGCTMTQYGAAGAPPTKRPVTYNNGFDGMFSDMYGIGAVIGMSDAENEARAKKLGEENPQQKLANQLLVDRLGMKDHKGLYAWCHSHIPTVREAIATGEPYKPRVWFDMSGNKLAMLGNAKSWYDVFPEVDYIIGQYPMLTSFHIEAADLVFPVREWLEEPMVNMTQLNTQWLQNECVHIGETVSHSIPAAQVVAK